MAGYRCVAFDDLCRLCSNASEKNVQIFSNGDLQKKILECLPITLSEKDRLPKKICSECKEYVEIFSDFRKSTQNAQKLLEGCLNTTKLRNGGQVYIKDETPIKKVLKPIQNPSPTKIIPNLNPVKQIKKNVISSSQNDLISSIMQAVGIQAGEETETSSGITQSNNNSSIQQQQQQHQQATLQNLPQYTFTIDGGGVIKPGQIQYKIENAGQSPLIAAANEEFLKLKQKPGIIIKKEPPQLRLAATATEDVQNKKPKINFVLQTSPQKQQHTKVQTSQILTSPTTATSFTSPTKAQILNIEKIMPAANQTSPTKHPIIMPIMVRSDGSRNTISTAGADFLQQAFQLSSNQTTLATTENKTNQPFMLMKIQSNSDGQLTLMPAAASAPPISQPQQLQISLSPQQLQQLGLQTMSTAQSQLQTQTVNVQQAHLTIPSSVNTTTTNIAQPPVSVQPLHREIQTQTKEVENTKDEDNYNDSFDDECDDNDNESFNESNENIDIEIKSSSSKRKATKSGKSTNKMKSSDLYEEPFIDPVHSEQAKKQLTQLTSFNTKKSGEESDDKNDMMNLTVCDVCKKTFKRKEFLMQHLKSHIGIRPFKCNEPTCNKSFSRKEHLLRHVSSHTGRKEFECNVCHKMFSRKDNLNKHKRIHPETAQSSSLRHNCSNCNKGFSAKAQLQKHQVNCIGKSSNETTEFIKTIKTTQPTKKAQQEEKKSDVKSEPQPPKLVQVLQPQSQIKTEPPIFKTIYTLPANFILNSNGTISTTTTATTDIGNA